MQTNWTKGHCNRDTEEIVEMDWTYNEERSWKHRQSTVVESTGRMEERAPHTELEEHTNDRAESEKHPLDGMQEYGKEQDEMESTRRRPMFHLEMKGVNIERERELYLGLALVVPTLDLTVVSVGRVAGYIRD